MNSQFNTSNWTGRTHRTRNEAFGPASDIYHEAKDRIPISAIIGSVVFVAVFMATFWVLSAWF